METPSVIRSDCLLQYQDLHQVKTAIDPQNLDQKTIGNMLRLGRDLTAKGYDMVAFNQFQPPILAQYSLDDQYLNTIYISQSCENLLQWTDVLIVNPEIIEVSVDDPPEIERCGSIGFGKLGMWISRPVKITISGTIIGSDWTVHLKYFNIYRHNGSGIFFHEVDHLHGKTALDHPEAFVDFRHFSKIDWQEKGIWNWGEYNPIEEMTTISTKWLIYDRKSGHFIVVDAAGNYLQDFK